eukprot:1116113-Prorocentrum_minimum.AAC.1
MCIRDSQRSGPDDRSERGRSRGGRHVWDQRTAVAFGVSWTLGELQSLIPDCRVETCEYRTVVCRP